MFALEQFKERLHEWPQYCSHIVEIPHLRNGYAALLGEIEEVTTDGSLAQQAIIASTKELVKPGSGGLTPAYGSGSSSPGSAEDATAASGSNLGDLGGDITVPNSAPVVIVPSQNPWETSTAELETSKPMETASLSLSTLNEGGEKGSDKSAVSLETNKSSPIPTGEDTTNSIVASSTLTTKSQSIGSPSSGSDKGSQKSVVSSTSPSTIVTTSGLGLLNEECGDAESTVLEEDMGTKLRLF